jgi:hypothetical protein
MELKPAGSEITRNILRSENIEDEESVEKMDTPFRRIVALTAMELVTGALLRTIYEALRETKT